jgi:hypothetical protein
MWGQGWPPKGGPGSGVPGPNGQVDWAAMAMQWVKSQEMMEKWRQQHYQQQQQQIQMMISAHNASMSNNIDPNIVSNPPPPPPSSASEHAESNSEKNNEKTVQVANDSQSNLLNNDSQHSTSQEAISPTATVLDSNKFSETNSQNVDLSLKKSVKSRFSNSSLFKSGGISNYEQNDSFNRPKPLFAAYEQVKVLEI